MKTKEITSIAISLVIWAAVLFLVFSLFSFSADDIDFMKMQRGDSIQNLCGSVGAFFSYQLYAQIGLASWILVLLLGLLAFRLMQKKPITGIWVRLYGSVFLIVSISCLLALADAFSGFKPSSLGLPISFGGIIGQNLSIWLAQHLNLTGTVIILVSVLLISLAVTSNLYFFELVWRLLKKVFSKKEGKKKQDKPAKKKPSKSEQTLGGVLKPQEETPSIDDPVEDSEDAPEDSEDSPPIPYSVDDDPIVIYPDDSSVEEEYEETNLPFDEDSSNAFPAPKKTTRKVKSSRALASNDISTDEYQLPPLSLFTPPTARQKDFTSILEKQGKAIETCLNDFGIDAKVVRWEVGPVVTLYEVALPPGVKVSSVSSLADNLAMSLRAQSLRIIAPIPGKPTIGLETPNPEGETVVFRDITDSENFEEEKYKLPMLLGKKGAGEPLVADLTKMPHVLIAGATGSGKSVCLNSMILSILAFKKPDEVKLIMIDPKMVELSLYKRIPHLIAPVVTDMRKAPGVLDWAVNQMEERYRRFSNVGVRDIAGYNKLGAERLDELLPDPEDREEYPDKFPYIVIVVDELADLMMISKKEIEWSITRLAQKSRAIGIHIVLATQRPSVNVITGLIKANMPCRISFQVSSKIDSRTIIDQMGADKLLGRGDMLYLPPSSPRLIRAQGVFVPDDEIKRVIDYIRSQGEPEYDPLLQKAASRSAEAHKGSDGGKPGKFDGGGKTAKKRASYTIDPEIEDTPKTTTQKTDELFDDAVRVVLEEQRGSVSLLQRKLTIGYGRASRLIDQMESAGIVGAYRGSKPREILFTLEEWEAAKDVPGGDGEA